MTAPTVIRKLLIANRGEIAIRIARAAAELDIKTVGIYSEDDAASLHVRATDLAVPIDGTGVAAYLDIRRIVAAAIDQGCDAVAPGYGFLSENADFAQACLDAGLVFVGPDPETLLLFGDKLRAKTLAREKSIPVLTGSDTGDPAEAAAFMATLPPGGAVMVKAIAGGGGRGIRLVFDAELLPAAIAACRSEALAAFGKGEVLIERFVANARHVEVQIVGDGSGEVVALGERDCTVQRRNQKLIEVTPAPWLDQGLRDRLTAAAVRLISATRYRGLATVEFLVDGGVDPASGMAFAFMEVNPRLQVEHTITEEVTGVDLVKTSLQLAAGRTLVALGLDGPRPPRGTAIQLRLTAETIDATGDTRSAGGTLIAYEPATGPGVRVDGYGYAGYAINPRFDSLLAKIIVHADTFDAACVRAIRAADEFRVEGTNTNLSLLACLLERPDFRAQAIHTRWFERVLPELLGCDRRSQRHFARDVDGQPEQAAQAMPEGCVSTTSPITGILVSLAIGPGDGLRLGQEYGFVEALKMQHALVASVEGVVEQIAISIGSLIREGDPITFLRPESFAAKQEDVEAVVDLDVSRPDLAEARLRIGYGLDNHRPNAVAKRRALGRRTARENIDDLIDPGTFSEYGALAIAAQRGRRSVEDLMTATPGDGLVGGTGTVNAPEFGDEKTRCMALSYDYTVLAGTQGYYNHRKTDRLLQVAERERMPVVFFTEGGGGRPGDVDAPGISGLDVPTFSSFARMSGKAPRIGIAAGYCFAGNAVLLGCCDVVIATSDANLGMGGPAMIEGGGLGIYRPDEIGPAALQSANGVIDLLVSDEREATATARAVLGMFQGRKAEWTCADQRLLRHAVPENRLRVYDVRRTTSLIADTDSFIELRRGFAKGMVTGFIRIAGRPLGVIANDAAHLSGAIDADGADKASRFMQLCDAFGLPILSLCDTPGFMVGPEAEKTAPIRHGARLFVVASSLTVPFFTVVLRRGYGLGAQAMSGGSFHATAFTVAWPSGEFGGMGVEGAVRLGFRKQLEEIADSATRDRRFRELVEKEYARGKAVSVAQYLEIDAVIDPIETRAWIERAMTGAKPRGSHRFIDAW